MAMTLKSVDDQLSGIGGDVAIKDWFKLCTPFY